MNNQDMPQPVLQQRSRGVAGKVTAITLAIALPVILCGILCVGTPTWLIYQWNRGIYYGYVTVDDPSMTYTQNVGDTVSFGNVHFQVSSMQFVKYRNTTYLVVHVRIKQDSAILDLPGTLVVYTSPVFDASGEHHAFTGNEIDPVPDNAVPFPYVSSRVSYDELNGITMNSTSEEGDILYKMPSPNGPFVLVLTPQSSRHYAWNSKINDCTFLPVFHC